ncbi:MAG: hypothetical protein V3S32_07180 [Acidimicrobiia bacterium]
MVRRSDDLDRVERALTSFDNLETPLVAAGVLAYRVTLAQGFAVGNKRTAILLARWLLDSNGVDGGQILPPDDRIIADLLVQTASGADVEAEIISILEARA